MALTALVAPRAAPSSEAAAAALLLSHVAWPRANGDVFADSAYEAALAALQCERPDLWREFRSADASKLISDLVVYKQRHYPSDGRRVVACGVHDGKIRVEWTK